MHQWSLSSGVTPEILRLSLGIRGGARPLGATPHEAQRRRRQETFRQAFGFGLGVWGFGTKGLRWFRAGRVGIRNPFRQVSACTLDLLHRTLGIQQTRLVVGHVNS